MAKLFYTERDIEDMIASGVMSLEISDSVVLTELAYEKARSRGMTLVQGQADNPPCAPVRPYISGSQSTLPAPAKAASAPKSEGQSLEDRIKSAVVARLGGQVDANLLGVIIRRVLNSTGTKEPVCCLGESGGQRCAPSSTPAPKG